MTETITTEPAPATLTEQIDFMLMACSDYGVALQVENASELLSEIEDLEVAAAQLEELARLIRLRANSAEGKAA
ncbi:hypothetical protein [Devosia sp. 919]|uniref:hypothetical protein n=1 Tax=Devosia sp. 919 TaxID=2726065 RepID=UPI001554EA4E|nr:hypothetical protein [Devosia sp. 919]